MIRTWVFSAVLVILSDLVEKHDGATSGEPDAGFWWFFGFDFALLSVEKKTPKRKKIVRVCGNKVLFLFHGKISRRVCDYIITHPDTTGFLPPASDAHLCYRDPGHHPFSTGPVPWRQGQSLVYKSCIRCE